MSWLSAAAARVEAYPGSCRALSALVVALAGAAAGVLALSCGMTGARGRCEDLNYSHRGYFGAGAGGSHGHGVGRLPPWVL